MALDLSMDKTPRYQKEMNFIFGVKLQKVRFWRDCPPGNQHNYPL